MADEFASMIAILLGEPGTDGYNFKQMLDRQYMKYKYDRVGREVRWQTLKKIVYGVLFTDELLSTSKTTDVRSHLLLFLSTDFTDEVSYY